MLEVIKLMSYWFVHYITTRYHEDISANYTNKTQIFFCRLSLTFFKFNYFALLASANLIERSISLLSKYKNLNHHIVTGASIFKQ